MPRGKKKRKERSYGQKGKRISAGMAFSILLAVIMIGSVLTYFPTEKEEEPEPETEPQEDPLAKLLGVEQQATDVLSDTEIAKILETKIFVRLFTSPFSAKAEEARGMLESLTQELPLEFEEVNMLKHCSKTSSSHLKENCPPDMPGYVIYAKGRMPLVTGPIGKDRLRELITGNFIVRGKYFDGDCPVCPQTLSHFRVQFENVIQFEQMAEAEANATGTYPVFIPDSEDLVIPEYRMLVQEVFPQQNKDVMYAGGVLTTNPSAMFTEACPGERVDLKYFYSIDGPSLGVSVCSNGTFPGKHEGCNFTAGMDSVMEAIESELGDKLSVERVCIGKGCDGNETLSASQRTAYDIRRLPALVFDCRYKRYGMTDLDDEIAGVRGIVCGLTAC